MSVRRVSLGIVSVMFFTQCKNVSVEAESSTPKIASGNPVASLSDSIAKSTVSIMNGIGGSFCTGTLISPTVVVTAAHCLSSPPSKMPFFVAFGLDVRGQKVDSPLSRAIQEVVIHPDYRPIDSPPFSPSYRIEDVALIKLADPAPKGFSPIPISAENWAFRKNPEVTIAGYGLTSDFFDKKGNQVSSNDTGVLRFTDGIITDSEKWTERSGLLIFQGQGKKSSCRGDSGGPMFGSNAQGLLLLGATMGGGECDNPDTVVESTQGFFTNLTQLRDWIECVSGVDTSLGIDFGPWNRGRCLTTSKQACRKMKIGSNAIPHLNSGRGGLRFNIGQEIPPGTPVSVSQWMGSWIRFSTTGERVLSGFAPLDIMAEDGKCDELSEGTKIKVLRDTLLKSVPAQGATLPITMKCSLLSNSELDVAVVRFPTSSEATEQHLFVTLKIPLEKCPVFSGFIPQNHVEVGFSMP